jgi:hypothetical protein
MATAAAVAAAGILSPVALSANAATPAADANPTACANRVNNTPKKLVDCVTRDDLWAHLVKFQQIADANPGADATRPAIRESRATRPRPTTWPTS